MVSGSESGYSMDSVDEREIVRRVEFEDGRVVHLPNEMSDERVLEVLDNNEELEFYHRYDAGDIVLERGEHHWDALSRRSEGTRRVLTSLRTSQMLAAVEHEDWQAVRQHMQQILDIDPRTRRSQQEVDYSRMPPLEYAPPPVQSDNEDDFWGVDHPQADHQHPINLEDDWGVVDNYQPVVNHHNQDDWGYQPVVNNPVIINNNNNAVAVENDWGDWAGEGAAVIVPPPSPDFQQQ